MAETQNMQNTQQEQATQQQQQQYVSKYAYVFIANLTKQIGVEEAEINVFLTANLLREIANRDIQVYVYDKRLNFSSRYSDVERKLRELIFDACVNKIVQSKKLSNYYKVILDTTDVNLEELDKVIEEIKKIEEERKREEEEIRRNKEIEKKEKLKIIEQIKQKVEELKQKQLVEEEYANAVYLVNRMRIAFDECYDLETLKNELEKANNVDAYKVLRDVIEKLKNEKENLYKQIEMLKRIIRKLTDEEELESKLEELEEESNELTKEEIKYLLNNVF